MNQIITISREFGSGGRELGRRLAEALHIEYYDDEILRQIAERTPFTEKYIQEVENHLPHRLHPISIGRSFLRADNYSFQQAQSIFQEQSRILREMAEKSDCVIVGRCADYVLREYNPYRIFVYADMESKVIRCKEKGTEQNNLTEDQFGKSIRKIDKSRAKYYEFHTGMKWGDKANYDLCVNTSKISIKEFTPLLAQFFELQSIVRGK